MRTLVIGSGGREHAIVRALVMSDSRPEVWAFPGNPGIFEYAQKAPLSESLDGSAVADFCHEYSIDLVVIGPEAPLAAGIADVLRLKEIPVFGPSQAAARLESSKW